MSLTLEQSLALQRQFASHIRDPGEYPAPEFIPDVRMGVYRDLFFSSLVGFLNDTFEHLQILIAEEWSALQRKFYREYKAQSPYFHRISSEFLFFLQETEALHPALIELARYEQRLFDAEVLDRKPGSQVNSRLTRKSVNDELFSFSDEILLQQVLVLKWDVFLEGFEYDIHALLHAEKWAPCLGTRLALPQFFAFYRSQSSCIKTAQLAPLTMAMLELFQEPRKSGAVIAELAGLAQLDINSIQTFAIGFIRQGLGELFVSGEICNLDA